MRVGVPLTEVKPKPTRRARGSSGRTRHPAQGRAPPTGLGTPAPAVSGLGPPGCVWTPGRGRAAGAGGHTATGLARLVVTFKYWV